MNEYTILKNGTILGKRGKPLKQVLHKNYLHVFIGNHKVAVHQIVAKKYVPNPLNKPEVHHIDGDKLNNNADNLMWVTRKEHIAFHKDTINVRAILNWETVDYIRANIDVSTNDLAKELNVSAACISLVKHNKSWKLENHP